MAKPLLYLERRLTRKYRSAYRHLDEFDTPYPGAALRPLACRDIPHSNGLIRLTRYALNGPARRIPRHTMARLVEDTIGSSSCSCEHDCCGHWFGFIRNIQPARNKPGKEIVVTEYFGRNI